MSVVTDLPASAKLLYRKPPTVRADLTSSEASLTWFVPDADLSAFLNMTAGKTEIIGGIGGLVVRVVPLQHPIYKWMYARSFDAVAFGWDTSVTPPKQYHEIRVNFANLPWPTEGNDAFITYSSRQDVRTMDLPKAGVLVGGAAPSNDRSTLVNGMGMSLTVHQLPYLNENKWNTAAGKVNSTTFRGIAPGYVKYLGPTTNYSISFAGNRTNEVTHEFSASPILWNQEYDETGTLSNVTVGGVARYASIDFNAVLFS